MPKLLRRSRSNADGAGNGAGAEQTPAEPAAGGAMPPDEASGALGPPDATAEMPPNPRTRVAASRDNYEVPPPAELPSTGVLGDNPPIPYDPAPAPPEPPRSSGSLIDRIIGDPGEQSAEERDRIAAMEFEQAIAPVMELMRAAVPGASTPEEAARILSENQPEVPQDPNPGAYVPGDAFDQDARVYYRLLRRDYEKNPRPSEKRDLSHHLHGAYNKLPGTRGW